MNKPCWRFSIDPKHAGVCLRCGFRDLWHEGFVAVGASVPPPNCGCKQPVGLEGKNEGSTIQRRNYLDRRGSN
jgi:hypothetical protein